MAFGSIGERLALIIDADSTGAIKAIKKVGDESQQQFSKAQTSQEKWSKGLMVGGAAAIGVAAVVGKGLLETVHAYAGYEEAQLKLQNTMSHMPQLAGASTKAFLDLANKISRTTEVDRDAVIAGESLLGTFGLTQKQILTLTPLVIDLSQKTGINLNTAFRLVGKTVETGTNGLLRQGVVIDKTKLKTDAFGTTVAALSQKVGGFATQQGKTFEGRLGIIRNQFHDLSEGVGKGATEQLTTMLGGVTGLTTGFGHLSENTQATIGKFGVIGTTGLAAAGSVALLAGAALKAKAALTVSDGVRGFLGTSLSGVGAAAVGTGAAVGVLSAAYMALTQHSRDVQKATSDLVTGMQTEGKTLDEVSRGQLAMWLSQHREEASVLAAAGVSLKEYFASFTNAKVFDQVNAKLRTYQDAQQAATGAQAKWASGVVDGSGKGLHAAVTVQKLTDNMKLNRSAMSGAAAETKAHTAATKDLAATTSDLADKTTHYTADIRNLREEEDKLTQKTLDVADAQRTLDGDIRNITTSILDVHDKQVAWTQAVKQHGATSEVAKRAEIDYYNAIDAVGQATDDAKRAVEDLAVKQAGASSTSDAVAKHTNDYVTALLAVEAKLAPNSPLRVWLAQYIAELHAVPSAVTTHFDTTGGNAGGTHAGPIVHRAGGGDLAPYETGVVGDVAGNAGELVQAGSGGARVRNPSQMYAMKGAQTIVQYLITVNAGIGTDGAMVGQKIVDSLVAHQRRTGPLPLRIVKAS